MIFDRRWRDFVSNGRLPSAIVSKKGQNVSSGKIHQLHDSKRQVSRMEIMKHVVKMVIKSESELMTTMFVLLLRRLVAEQVH
jgi:hypothetical protein